MNNEFAPPRNFTPHFAGRRFFTISAFISGRFAALIAWAVVGLTVLPEVQGQPNSPSASPSATPASPTAQVKPKPAPPPTATVTTPLETSRKFPKAVTKLVVDDLQKGRGRSSAAGSRLVVHFQAWLYDPTQPLGRGPQFESTLGKAPYKFTLQNSEALHIKGWEDGLVDMKVGGKRRLIIPPDLAYGANGAGQVVPPGATLMYEIQLVDIE